MTLCVIMISTSCTLQEQDDVKSITKLKSVTKFEQSKLYGHWIRTNKSDKIENSDFGTVTKFNLKNDLTAEVEILDSIGFKTVAGNWEINNKKRVGSDSLNFTIQADVLVKFQKDKNHFQYLSLIFEELDNKKVLTSDNKIYTKK